MPIYVYQCPACGSITEVLVRGKEHKPMQPICQNHPTGPFVMVRQPTAGAIHFKGSGWTPKGPGRRE